MKYKKTLLWLGNIGMLTASIFLTISCNSNNETLKHHMVPKVKNLPQNLKDLKNEHKGYYDSVLDDLTKEELFDSISNIQSKYWNQIGSYNDLWNIYSSVFTDVYDEEDETIYDIYSELPDVNDPYNFIPIKNQDKGKHSKEGDSYNREHIIPQSYFGKSINYIHNDAHFIYPVDSYVNGKRGNLPYGNVIQTTWTSKNGSKIGNDANGIKVFEPIDEFKGDIARATIYFQLTWNKFSSNKHDYTKYSIFQNDFPYIENVSLNTFKEWSLKDPVNEFNKNINDNIAKLEGGLRNPFIDMPELINLMF